MVAMGCVLAQDGGRTTYIWIGKTGFAYCVGQHSKWRMSINFCLIALCIAPFELVMPVSFNVLVQYQTFLPIVNQMHVVVSLGVVFLLGAIS